MLEMTFEDYTQEIREGSPAAGPALHHAAAPHTTKPRGGCRRLALAPPFFFTLHA